MYLRLFFSRDKIFTDPRRVSESLHIFRAAAELADSRIPFVLITVIQTKGSSPRDAGAKMIWRPGQPHAFETSPERKRAGSPPPPLPDDRGSSSTNANGITSHLIGTVGGGQFEHLVIDAAEKHFRNRTCGTEHYVLGADADQCCGGTMDVFFEYHGSPLRLVIFGAGHVAKELADLLEGSPMSVAIADDRPDWNSPERFPRATRLYTWDAGIAASLAEPAHTLACVMTCSHDRDLEILRGLLRTSPASRPPAFVGLIGSRSKRACLFGRLVASGIDEETVRQVHCPIGVGDTGKAPKLVAISMAAQLLLEAKKLAPAITNVRTTTSAPV